MHACTRTHTRDTPHTCVYIYIYIYMYMRVCVCARVFSIFFLGVHLCLCDSPSCCIHVLIVLHLGCEASLDLFEVERLHPPCPCRQLHPQGVLPATRPTSGSAWIQLLLLPPRQILLRARVAKAPLSLKAILRAKGVLASIARAAA